ncbi:MAG TPA: lactonase family protein [Candidatus Acidoferrum sp.]|nr:lactonase family protein [Candidatus Acidoferrum sp.]
MRIAQRVVAALLLCVALVALISAGSSGAAAAEKHYLVYVGTYTTKTASKGIYAFHYDASTGKLSPIGVAADTADPSWVAIHPNGKYLYAANEAGKKSMVSAFAIDAQSAKLTLLNQLPALGEDPCYLSFDRTGKYLFAANYTSGNITVFAILPDGKLAEHAEKLYHGTLAYAGRLGPNIQRQEAPHAHWIQPSADNGFVYVADLGLDSILIYRFNLAAANYGRPILGWVGIENKGFDRAAMLDPGTGPRHAAFSSDEKFMYVVGELNSTVTAFAKNSSESFQSIQNVPMLPAGFSGRNDAAELAIHPNGKFLYASNRGHDSIAEFHIDPASGKLTAAGDFSVLGKEPRHFAIDPSGNFLLAENQLSDKIVTFRIDQKTGALTPTGDSVEVPSPVCLVFLPVE